MSPPVRRDSSAHSSDRNLLKWDEGEKVAEMQRWSRRVLADDRLGRGECAVAWALTYAFNGNDGRCWQTNATIAEAARLSATRVAEMLRNLDLYGHIQRKNELVGGRSMRVIRPTITRQFDQYEPRKRRGGIRKSEHSLVIESAPSQTDAQCPNTTDGQWSNPTDGQSPCIRDESLMESVTVAASGTTCLPPPDDDWDLDEENTIPPPPPPDDWDD